jgi:hypothetical protein
MEFSSRSVYAGVVNLFVGERVTRITNVARDAKWRSRNIAGAAASRKKGSVAGLADSLLTSVTGGDTVRNCADGGWRGITQTAKSWSKRSDDRYGGDRTTERSTLKASVSSHVGGMIGNGKRAPRQIQPSG